MVIPLRHDDLRIDFGEGDEVGPHAHRASNVNLSGVDKCVDIAWSGDPLRRAVGDGGELHLSAANGHRRSLPLQEWKAFAAAAATIAS